MATDLELLELEVTGRCQLECVHCYSSSGPSGSHGEMQVADWQTVIDQAAAMDVPRVQLIGGEPTLYPGFTRLVVHALGNGLEVEIYSNLVKVTQEMWELFTLPGVLLATSYYSDDEAVHNAVTARRSHPMTRANIEKALALGIPLRVAVIDIVPGQRAEQAGATIKALGVEHVQIDQLRQIGRGVRDEQQGISQLCGACANGRLAVLPTGDVVPCVLSRWIRLGNVRKRSLLEIAEGTATRVRRELAGAFSHRDPDGGCAAPVCGPHLCPPPKSRR